MTEPIPPSIARSFGSPDWDPCLEDAAEVLDGLRNAVTANITPVDPIKPWLDAAEAIINALDGLARCSQCVGWVPKTDLHDGVCEGCYDSGIDCPVCGGCGGHPDLGCSGCGGSGMRRLARGSRNDPDGGDDD